MKRLSHVAFAHPIPIPGTHVRQSDFSALDGWTLEDEDGCITLSKGATRFYTYVSASCVEATRAVEGAGGATSVISEATLGNTVLDAATLLEPKAGKRKR